MHIQDNALSSLLKPHAHHSRVHIQLFKEDSRLLSL
jgi:hypothetical protein